MSKNGNIKDMIRAARPGTVIIITLQDFKEIVEDVAKLLQPPLQYVGNPFVQNVKQSESVEKKEVTKSDK